MKSRFCFLMAVVFTGSVSDIQAQSLDTVRRKDANGVDFVQVKRGDLVVSEGYLANGVPEGTWIYYWDSGYPQLISNFRNGKKNGVQVQMTVQGNAELLENYNDDQLEGPRRVYQPGSLFIMEEAYYSEGRKHGLYNKRYPTGKPQEEANFNMDQRDGKTTWFYETGEKAAEYNYRNGLIEGEVAAYFKNGRVSEYGVYKNNERAGDWKEFYENGNVKAEGTYINGKKEGNWKEYDESGKLVKTVKYKNGEERK